MATQQRKTWEVFLDATELQPITRVGWLYQHLARTATPASFEYDQTWLRGSDPFRLDPRLELWRGAQHPAADLPAFGIFMDSAPDRWGRVLMERREAAAADREGRAMRTLREVDFLLDMHDEARMGALRFRSDEHSPFVDHRQSAAPPVTSLPELAHISRRVEEPGAEKLPEYEQWLAILGLRVRRSAAHAPRQISVTQIAAFGWQSSPRREDRYDIGAWEFVAHQLAKRAGVSMPAARLDSFGGTFRTYCSCRFDRTVASDGGESRRMYASAMTLLGRRDGEEGASYIDLAQFIMDEGASKHVAEDLEQLFRRMVFNILIGNRDDHLRNHGFIREPSGWRISPAFDINPSPFKAEHALTIDGTRAAPNIGCALGTAELYRLDASQARNIEKDVRKALSQWRSVAESQGLGRPEMQRMETIIQA